MEKSPGTSASGALHLMLGEKSRLDPENAVTFRDVVRRRMVIGEKAFEKERLER